MSSSPIQSRLSVKLPAETTLELIEDSPHLPDLVKGNHNHGFKATRQKIRRFDPSHVGTENVTLGEERRMHQHTNIRADIGLSDEELKEISTIDFNKLLNSKGISQTRRVILRQERRTIKNRVYSVTSRTKLGEIEKEAEKDFNSLGQQRVLLDQQMMPKDEQYYRDLFSLCEEAIDSGRQLDKEEVCNISAKVALKMQSLN